MSLFERRHPAHFVIICLGSYLLFENKHPKMLIQENTGPIDTGIFMDVIKPIYYSRAQWLLGTLLQTKIEKVIEFP